jgi:hypothetical protein
MHAHRIAVLLVVIGSICAAAAAVAQDGSPPLRVARHGDHPAVVVQRLQARAGYDYTAQFYLHPAGLRLLAEAPRERGEHPALLVWRREHDRQELLARIEAARALVAATTER